MDLMLVIIIISSCYVLCFLQGRHGVAGANFHQKSDLAYGYLILPVQVKEAPDVSNSVLCC